MPWTRGSCFKVEGNDGKRYWGVLLNLRTHEAFFVEDGRFCDEGAFSVGVVPVCVRWIPNTQVPELARLAFRVRLV